MVGLLRGLLADDGAHAFFDFSGYVGVDVGPVLEDPGERQLFHTVGDVVNDVVHQDMPLHVVIHHFMRQDASLAPVIVVLMQRGDRAYLSYWSVLPLLSLISYMPGPRQPWLLPRVMATQQ